MFLNRIRPPKPKFAAEEIKAEFVPEALTVKAESVSAPAPALAPRPGPEPTSGGGLYALLPYAELKRLAAERGLKASRNPKKTELVELLEAADGQN